MTSISTSPGSVHSSAPRTVRNRHQKSVGTTVAYVQSMRQADADQFQALVIERSPLPGLAQGLPDSWPGGVPNDYAGTLKHALSSPAAVPEIGPAAPFLTE